MNIQAFLIRLIRLCRAAQPQAMVEPAAEADSATEPDRPPGCGWFDSSHELRRGLIVREHATADALAGDLPLVNWLELHLSGWRSQQPA